MYILILRLYFVRLNMILGGSFVNDPQGST